MINRRESLGLLFVLGLGGCGFRLRGEVELSAFMNRMQLLTTLNDSDLLLRTLRSRLKSAGVDLIEPSDTNKPNVILRIDEHQENRRSIAKYAGGKMREDELRQSARFNVYRYPDSALLGATVLSSVRTVQIDDTQFLGSSESEEIARRGLVNDIADAMMRFLLKISETQGV